MCVYIYIYYVNYIIIVFYKQVKMLIGYWCKWCLNLDILNKIKWYNHFNGLFTNHCYFIYLLVLFVRISVERRRAKLLRHASFLFCLWCGQVWETHTPSCVIFFFSFFCRWGLNLRYLIQPSETLPVELTETHMFDSTMFVRSYAPSLS